MQYFVINMQYWYLSTRYKNNYIIQLQYLQIALGGALTGTF